MVILSELPTSAVSDIVWALSPRLYRDFIRYLPPEICLKILACLDPVSLVNVIRTCRTWCDLALDSALWERLYHMEGWKAVRTEIESCEAIVNVGLNDSIGNLHRIQSSEGHTSKIRALVSDDDDDVDVSMPGLGRLGSRGVSSGPSMFGPPPSALSNQPALTPSGEMDLDRSSSQTGTSGSLSSSSESRAKGRYKYTTPESSLPPILPPQDPKALRRSTLWMWDASQSRYRINWKYLYNMRRRLESNWELAKYVTFQFPHPNHPEEGHRECVYSLQFDANHLVSGSRDKTMRIWNIHTRRLARPPLLGHRGSVLCLQFDADPQEDLLISGSSDSNVIIWRFSTGEILHRIVRAHHESVLNVRFDKRILVTSSKDRIVRIFNRRPLHPDDSSGNNDVIYPVGRIVRSYGYEPQLSRQLPVKPPYTMIGRLDGHSAAVNAIQVRGDAVVSVSGDRHIKVWNWADQVCTLTIPAHDKGIACVEFDGRRIVSGSSDNEVCIFDAATGLKVATLRGHNHLVRTVQAGFCDLPYSKAEDEAEARRVDAEYFKAVEEGLVDPNDRNRRANAGSSRPADVQAYGAKLPPGGGGGRTYGRIVSGSYDQTIIIWRRDKEGVWKPAHHLRQEEAAARAQQREASLPAPDNPIAGLAQVAPQPSVGPSAQQPGPSAGGQSSAAPVPGAQNAQRLSPSVSRALIDQVVPAGAAALQQALANYPDILNHHSYLQVTIEREPSAIVRAQLRQVVSDALLSIQNAQTAGQRSEGTAVLSNQATAGSAGAAEPLETPPAATPQPPPAEAAVATPSAAAQAPAQGQPNASAPPPHHTGGGGHAHLGVAQGHIPAPENTPARVFKLQFDARKIICCCQSPIISGWDFCNGDPELEEASRFFATVD